MGNKQPMGQRLLFLRSKVNKIIRQNDLTGNAVWEKGPGRSESTDGAIHSALLAWVGVLPQSAEIPNTERQQDAMSSGIITHPGRGQATADFLANLSSTCRLIPHDFQMAK